jgi:hypothetical protein
LRLAEAAAHQHGLEDALSLSRRTAKRAVVHIDATDGSEDAAEAIRATAAETEDAVRDMEEDEAMILQSSTSFGGPLTTSLKSTCWLGR